MVTDIPSSILGDRHLHSTGAKVPRWQYFGQSVGPFLQPDGKKTAGIGNDLAVGDLLGIALLLHHAVKGGVRLTVQDHFSAARPGQLILYLCQPVAGNGILRFYRQGTYPHIYVLQSHGLHRSVRHIVAVGRRRNSNATFLRVVLISPRKSLRVIADEIAVVHPPFVTLQRMADFFYRVVPPLLGRDFPGVGIGFGIIAGITQLALFRYRLRRLRHQGKIGHAAAVFGVGDSNEELIPYLFYRLSIPRKGLCHKKAGALGHQHTINMPAIGMLKLDHVPADLEVIRIEHLRGDLHSVHLHGNGIAVGPQVGKDRFLIGEILQPTALHRVIHHVADRVIHRVGIVAIGCPRYQRLYHTLRIFIGVLRRDIVRPQHPDGI